MEGERSCYRGGQFNGGKMVITEVVQFREEGQWSCYRIAQFNGGRNVTEVASLMEGEWSC